MKKNNITKILIIDDSIEHIKILINLLDDLYDIYFAKNGEEGLTLLPIIAPDLILLDILMPGMDGFEVCKKIKQNEKWKETPLIFISAQDDDEDETKGLSLGAIDFITKPFSPAIVKARIRNHLQLRSAMQELEKLYGLALDASPLTGLPGNNSIAQHIENSLLAQKHVCIVYADIDNFKPFNDKYGFVRGDEVIRFTAEVLQQAHKEVKQSETFVGHLGGDDFIMVIPQQQALFTAQEIINQFDSGILHFYNRLDLDNRCIQAANRQGEQQIFPIMSISIAVIDLSSNRYSTYLEVSDACAEMKKIAKATPGSTVYFDQRKE